MVGFVNEGMNELEGTVCIYCDKHLEGWLESDIPADEHHQHSKSCALFNLTAKKARKKTFIGEKYNEVRFVNELIDQGFFMYNIKVGVKYELFCFKCGFNINDSVALDKELLALHHNSCYKNVRRFGKFNKKNPKNLFYVDLLCGKYVNEIVKYCYSDIYVPFNFVSEMEDLIRNIGNINYFLPTGDALLCGFENLIKKIDEEFDKDVENVVSMIDDKYFKKH
jgi:hypothetical protein